MHHMIYFELFDKNSFLSIFVKVYKKYTFTQKFKHKYFELDNFYQLFALLIYDYFKIIFFIEHFSYYM
jgi:hypothetical protein